MPALPISSFSAELITLLEFARVAVKEFPRAADKILDHMDLSDEAFLEDVQTLCKQVEFNFDEDEDDE
jgi:hypothetical protein